MEQLNFKPSKKLKNMLIAVLCFSIAISGVLAVLTSSDSKTNTFRYGNVEIEIWEKFDSSLDGTIDGLGADGTFDKLDKSDEIYGPGEQTATVSSNRLVPGQKIEKAPWIVNTGDESAYVYAVVGVPVIDIFASYKQNKDGTTATSQTIIDYYNNTNNTVYEPVSVYYSDSGSYIEGFSPDWTMINSYYGTRESSGLLPSKDTILNMHYYVFHYNKLDANQKTPTLFDAVAIKENYAKELNTITVDLIGDEDVGSFVDIPVYAYAIEASDKFADSESAWETCSAQEGWTEDSTLPIAYEFDDTVVRANLYSDITVPTAPDGYAWSINGTNYLGGETINVGFKSLIVEKVPINLVNVTYYKPINNAAKGVAGATVLLEDEKASCKEIENYEPYARETIIVGSSIELPFDGSLSVDGSVLDWQTEDGESGYTGMEIYEDTNLLATYSDLANGEEVSKYLVYIIIQDSKTGEIGANFLGADSTSPYYPSSLSTVVVPSYLEFEKQSDGSFICLNGIVTTDAHMTNGSFCRSSVADAYPSANIGDIVNYSAIE